MKNCKKICLTSLMLIIESLFANACFADGWSDNSKASNMNSILNTRHNLTMSYLAAISGGGEIMDGARNNYAATCVYCHTPHGANKQIKAPLWNRTINTGSYSLYDKPRTLDRPISQPGPNSLTCLSCHDGTISIDSIINMPGSGRYGPTQETSSSNAFLSTWQNASGTPSVHATLGPRTGAADTCTYCHSTASGAVVTTIPFDVFVIGTDLTNDHPIGVLYPTTFDSGIDFAEPTATKNGMKFFDTNGNGFAEKNEVRLYDSGDGPEVECASCHDPHGVPSSGTGTKFNPSFLRINNGIADNGAAGTAGIASAGPSALCLTCHTK